MLPDSWKGAFKTTSEDPQEILLKSTKNMKVSGFFNNFKGLYYSSYQLFGATFQGQFFLSFNFYFGHNTLCGPKTWELGLNFLYIFFW